VDLEASREIASQLRFELVCVERFKRCRRFFMRLELVRFYRPHCSVGGEQQFSTIGGGYNDLALDFVRLPLLLKHEPIGGMSLPGGHKQSSQCTAAQGTVRASPADSPLWRTSDDTAEQSARVRR